MAKRGNPYSKKAQQLSRRRRMPAAKQPHKSIASAGPNPAGQNVWGSGLSQPAWENAWQVAAGVKPPTPAAPAKPPTPASPKPGLPKLPGAEGAKTAAEERYKLAQQQHNSGMYQAALSYGDLGLINSLAGQGYGSALTEAPNFGQLAQIGKQRTSSRTGAMNDRNKAGTFFSSLMSKDLGDIDNASSIAQAEALRAYQAAQQQLNDALGGALIDRNQTIADATQQEFDYGNSLTPEPTGTPVTAAPTKQPSAQDVARYMWGMGHRTGKSWANVIKALGYDPRKKGKLVFRK